LYRAVKETCFGFEYGAAARDDPSCRDGINYIVRVDESYRAIDSRMAHRFIAAIGGCDLPWPSAQVSRPGHRGRIMSSFTSISPDKLSRLIGTAKAPVLIDVRSDDEFASEPRLIPGASRRSHQTIDSWKEGLQDRSVVVICDKGKQSSEGTAALLRHDGIAAEILEGGHAAWIGESLQTVISSKIPSRDAQGRTVWVTRLRPKVDRIACPWLIRRFVDPNAVFLFVPVAEVLSVAERFDATPFDIEHTFWSHRGDLCTFDVMLKEFGLSTPALERLAVMVRAADTDRLELSPEAPGLLAASLGLSRVYDDDLEQLGAGILLYDAFYRWCRDATRETHNWPTNKGPKS
jgi:rhodanese-related sulfurtransferase